MDIHPQFGEIRTIRDFLVRLALIVSGVVIAVTVTQCRDKNERNALAEQMKARLLIEVGENTKVLDRVIKAYDASKISLKEGVDVCRNATAAKSLDADAAKKIDGMQIDVRTPSLNATQWTLALSNQSIRDFSIDDASDFANLYSLQKSIDDVFLQHKSAVTTAFVDAALLRVGASADEIARGCRAIAYLYSYTQSGVGNLQALKKRYAKVGAETTSSP
jgi:hypothetical protein